MVKILNLELKTSDRVSFLIILFTFFKYFFPVILPSLFFTGTFIATPSQEKKIANKTFFALKDRFEIIGRLLY
jgi:hypothetical protein